MIAFIIYRNENMDLRDDNKNSVQILYFFMKGYEDISKAGIYF